uniref:Cytochrome c oxidase subunit 2 n=1 Tax=Ophirina amphinema TaxID=2108040 RepID=A0A348AYU3_9EUKA|nr:cytochrome c oxidase subunit 2 [Ophirina amphinema]
MINLFKFVGCDSANAWQCTLQDPATPVAEGIVNLHHDVTFFLAFIVVFVFVLIANTLYRFSYTSNPIPSNTIHKASLEIIWTMLPGVILVLIAVPSFSLLYGTDEVVDPAITVKVVGHQWYWSYEYTDYETVDGEALAYDSYMVEEGDLEYGEQRLLSVDNQVVVPVNTHVRFIVTSSDVLHSWCVPSLGVKLDACPGRLNEVSVFIKREGEFFGQCSEICGVNHGFMPIAVDAVPYEKFIDWISDKLEDL